MLDIDFDHPAVTSFVPYKLPKKETHGADSGGGGGGKPVIAGASSDDSVGQRLKMLSLYRPKEQLSPIFEAADASVRGFHLPTEIRQIVASYI